MKSVKTRKSLIMTLLVLALMAGFFIGLPFYQRSKLALPRHVDTRAEFSAEMPKPEKIVVFEKNGSPTMLPQITSTQNPWGSGRGMVGGPSSGCGYVAGRTCWMCAVGTLTLLQSFGTVENIKKSRLA